MTNVRSGRGPASADSPPTDSMTRQYGAIARKPPHHASGARVSAYRSSRGRTRTCDPTVNSRLLYQLSYAGIVNSNEKGNRAAVAGQSLPTPVNPSRYRVLRAPLLAWPHR